MKLTVVILLAWSSAFGAISHAQKESSGIYLTADDFNHHKLSLTRAGHERHAIRLNEFLNLPTITVVSDGRKHVLSKDSIFGYQSCDNTSFRFFKRGTYEIVNRGATPLLYRQAVTPGGKGAHTIVSWYFSTDAVSAVLPLTRENIRVAFSQEPAFVEGVYDSFGSDEELSEYDQYRKVYKLTRIYQNK